MGTLLISVVQGPSLLGRDMMSKFTLPWQDIIQQYSDLFETSSVGKLKGIQVLLQFGLSKKRPWGNWWQRTSLRK